MPKIEKIEIRSAVGRSFEPKNMSLSLEEEINMLKPNVSVIHVVS